MTKANLLDSRYEGIIHLVTAADGANDFYGSISNEARYESEKEAIDKDIKIRNAYYEHSHWIMIDNNVPDFNSKISRVKDAVYDIVGVPTGANFHKKFLLIKTSKNNGLNSKIPIDMSEINNYSESEVIIDYIDYFKGDKKII